MELESRVNTQVEALRLEKRLGSLRAELEDRLDGHLKVRCEAMRLELQQATRTKFDEASQTMCEDVSERQQRLVTELRNEMVQALSRESAAIGALDEQLWVTDRRLGQRIDELA